MSRCGADGCIQDLADMDGEAGISAKGFVDLFGESAAEPRGSLRRGINTAWSKCCELAVILLRGDNVAFHTYEGTLGGTEAEHTDLDTHQAYSEEMRVPAEAPRRRGSGRTCKRSVQRARAQAAMDAPGPTAFCGRRLAQQAQILGV